MKQRKLNRLVLCTLIGLTFGVVGQAASAGDYDRERKKVKGTSSGMFLQSDPLNGPVGPGPFRGVSDVGIEGTFNITVGDKHRSGRFRFPHLLVVDLEFAALPPPPSPEFVSGYVRGALVWIFDGEDVICDGPVYGEFDETGRNLVSRAKLDCSDGSRLRLKIRDTNVVPGVSVEARIRGKLIWPEDDDW